jgi:hypothetical protein
MQFVHIGSRSIKTVGNRGDLLPLEPCATTETTLLARAQRSGGRVWVIDNQIGVTGIYAGYNNMNVVAVSHTRK